MIIIIMIIIRRILPGSILLPHIDGCLLIEGSYFSFCPLDYKCLEGQGLRRFSPSLRLSGYLAGGLSHCKKGK